MRLALVLLLLAAACSDSHQGDSPSLTAAERATATTLCLDPIAQAGIFANSHLGANGTTIPYIICNPNQLRNAYSAPGKNFELGADIIFLAPTTPVAAPFSGVLDGKGFSVKDLSITRPGIGDVALFREITDSEIKNISFENFTIQGYERTGLIAGTIHGNLTLTNVHLLNGTVSGITQTGGLFGKADASAHIVFNQVFTQGLAVNGNTQTGGLIGLISDGASFLAQDLTLAHNVYGLSAVGGILGEAFSAAFANVALTGNVQSAKTHVGGLVGLVATASFDHVSMNGNVTALLDAEEIFIGGIVGLASQGATFSDVSYQGSITTGGDHAGGIAGRVQQGSFTRVTSAGLLTVLDHRYNSIRHNAGGIAGHIVTASAMLDCHSSMVLDTQSNYVGGLVGFYQDSASSVRTSYATGNVTGRHSLIGGAFGFYEGDVFEDTWASGNVVVNIPTPQCYAGGLAGYTNSKALAATRLHASGNVSAQNGTADYLGGLVGFFRAGEIQDSWAKGQVSGGRNFIGGLVGISRGTIANSYALGDVSGSLRYVGGLAGAMVLSSGLTRSFALGNVTGADLSGGLVGWVATNTLSDTVTSSYAFGQVTKASGSSYPDSSFGPLAGDQTAVGMVNASNNFYRSLQQTAGHNSVGVGLAENQLTQSTSYLFDFTSDPAWRMPTASTVIPGRAGVYPWPLPSWAGGQTVQMYHLGGPVTGLVHSTVTLTLNGQTQLSIPAGATSFVFPTQFFAGDIYSVTISAQPTSPALTCTLANAAGTVGNGDVTNLTLSCPAFLNLSIGAIASDVLSGTTQALTVSAALAGGGSVDVTNQAALSLVGTGFSLAGLNLTADAPGSATVSATFLNLSANRIFTAFVLPAAPSNAHWAETSPAQVPNVTAQWTLSSSSGLVSQRVNYFSGAACLAPVSSHDVAASVTNDGFTATDGQIYSFNVTAFEAHGFSATSPCSLGLSVNLPTPPAVANLSTSATWVTGAAPLASPLFSWTFGSGVTDVKGALGSTSGGSDITNWISLGLVSNTSFNALNLTACAPIYASFRTANTYGKLSPVATAAAFRWDNSAPSAPGTPTVTGVASSYVAPLTSWALASDNCQLSRYEMAIGTSAGDADVVPWTSVGGLSTYQPTNGIGGFNFTLDLGTNYYTSVRAVDAAGLISPVVSSAAWSIPVSPTAKIFWFDSSDVSTLRDSADHAPQEPGFDGSIATWEDLVDAHLYNATAANSSAAPTYLAEDQHISFNGTTQYLQIPTGATFDGGTFKTKNIFVSFSTGLDTISRQVVYEEGDKTRGMNLYLLAGQLYCAFWNTSNGGDGAQSVLYATTNVSGNSVYHAALILDYSNYTTASGPNGTFRCLLNGTQMQSDLSTTSRLFSHAGGAAFGATYNGTRYHDSTTNSTGSFFAGRILEAFSFQQNPTTPAVLSIIAGQTAKWAVNAASAPSNLALINNSTLSKGASASWQAISPSYFNTHHYLVAIGTSAGGTEAMPWTDIGNVLSYQPSGLTLSYDTDYYFVVKAVDPLGNKSLPAISSAWRVNRASDLELAGTFLKLDASDPSSLVISTTISAWNNLNGPLNVFTQSTASKQPLYDPVLASVRFDQTNDWLSAPAEANLTNSLQKEKSVTVVFTTGADVDTQQFIYEQGSKGNRGMSIYLVGGEIFCLFHNSKNGGDGAQAPVYFSTTAQSSSKYVVTVYLDYTNYTSSSGPDGAVGCFVNGVNLGTGATTSRLYADGSAVYLGARSSATWHNGNSTSTADWFGGDIHELQVTNQAFTPSAYQTLHSALINKWL